MSFFSGQGSFIFKVRRVTGIFPGIPELYRTAFIHKSTGRLARDGTPVNNERLEFLGDAILDAVMADYLYKAFPGRDEGFLTQLKSRIVKRKQLNRIATGLGLGKLLTANAGIGQTGKNVLGNALEALIGAIYLDKGFRRTKRYIIRRILRFHVDLDRLSRYESDFKSRLIEWAQKHKKEVSFVSREEIIQEGSGMIFHSSVFIMNDLFGKGQGHSKKEAEQEAAGRALDKVGSQPDRSTTGFEKTIT